MCKYCKTNHIDGLQAGADFGDGEDLFRLMSTCRIAVRRDNWDFALHSIKIKFCPFCGQKVGER